MTIMKTNHHGRLENTTTCLPIAYGSVAFYLGSKADEYHTHRWTLYVRSPDQTFDLGLAISKVVFQLHPSFPQPTRELVEPPFEVTETGWGEFEASIRIVWRDDADERSTILTHGIRLYPNRTPTTGAGPSACMDTTVPVVSEKYDEVVFTNPKAAFHNRLVNGNVVGGLPYPISNEPNVAEHFRTYGDEEEMKFMISAKGFLEGELRNVKERLLRVDLELEEAKRSLSASSSSSSSAGTKGTGDVRCGVAAGGSSGGGGSNADKAAIKPPGATSATSSDSQPAGKKARSS